MIIKESANFLIGEKSPFIKKIIESEDGINFKKMVFEVFQDYINVQQ